MYIFCQVTACSKTTGKAFSSLVIGQEEIPHRYSNHSSFTFG